MSAAAPIMLAEYLADYARVKVCKACIEQFDAVVGIRNSCPKARRSGHSHTDGIRDARVVKAEDNVS